MKKLLFICFLGCIAESYAQTPNQFRFGYQISRFQNDFGIGVHIHSPKIYTMNMVLKGNLNYLDHLDTDNQKHIWSPYGLYQLGIKSNTFITSKVNLYAEGGFELAHENKTYSTNSLAYGGYGLFGFEFYFTEGLKHNPSYFIELGGNFVNAIAEKIIYNPNYASGFIISVGFRF